MGVPAQRGGKMWAGRTTLLETSHSRLNLGSARRSNPTQYASGFAAFAGQNLRFPPAYTQGERGGRSVRVFYRAAVGVGFWGAHGLAAQNLVKRGGDIVFRASDVSGVGGFFVVDRAVVNEDALGIDHIHLGGDFGVVSFADFSRFIEQEGRSGGLSLGAFFRGIGGSGVTLLAGCGRADREPHNAFRSGIGLEFLHVAGAVVLRDKRAVVVHPLEHDDFAFVVGEGDFFTRAIGECEIRRGLADGNLGVGDGHGGEQDEECFFHRLP